MAWQLMVEVLDHAPACLTPAEKLVLLAIAERTRLDDRYCPPIPTEELARRAQVAPSSLGKVFGRLKRHGLEVRIPIGTNRRGEPMFAVTGHAVDYRLPLLPPPYGCQCQMCAKVGRESDLRSDESPTIEPKVGRESDLRSDESPVRPDESPTPTGIPLTGSPVARAPARPRTRAPLPITTLPPEQLATNRRGVAAVRAALRGEPFELVDAGDHGGTP